MERPLGFGAPPGPPQQSLSGLVFLILLMTLLNWSGGAMNAGEPGMGPQGMATLFGPSGQ